MAKKAKVAQPTVAKASKKTKAAKQAAVVAETKKAPKKVRVVVHDLAFVLVCDQSKTVRSFRHRNFASCTVLYY